MKNIFGLIAVIIHALAIIVGIYAILTLFNLVPGFKSLFGDDPLDYVKFLKLILFVFIPIGIALFVNQAVFGESIPTKVLTVVGLLLMVVPALVLHIQLMDVIFNGNFGEFCTSGEVSREYVGLMLIFPVICLYLTTTFQLIGKDQFIIHADYDDGLNNTGFILPYLYVCGGNSLVMIFIGTMGNLGFFSILTLVVGCISLAVMGISRLKNGSPFAY